MQKHIMHLDIDAFFASVEQVRNPRLAGKPVIVGSGVIASCSYEARRFGLYAGMSLAAARKRCPGAVILAGDYQVYRSFAEKLWEVCRRFTPTMETLLDDAYLDLSGSEKLHGNYELLARRLKACIYRETGLTVSMGLATSRTVARMASASGKPNGLVVVPPGKEMDFIRDLPVDKLPGGGHATYAVLTKLNVTTIGALSNLPRWSLEALFGANGCALFERAHGRDSHVLSPSEAPQSISRETSFHKDTTETDEIEGMLYYLTERAMKTLRELGLLARTVAVKIRYSDSTGDASSRSLPEATALDSEAFQLARQLLWRLYCRRVSLHNLGITLSNFTLADKKQPELFNYENRLKLEGLYQVLDEVRRRFGYGAIVAGKSIELLKKLPRNDHGFILRTPSLTK